MTQVWPAMLALLFLLSPSSVSRASGQTPHTPSKATEQADDPRTSLLKGVAEIAAPGAPGPLVVFGEHAFVVAVGKSEGKDIQLPVVAAGDLGKGRVVAFGHTGYLDKDVLKVADTAVLIENSLRWASRQDHPRVGIVGDAGLAGALKARGWNTTELSAQGWESNLKSLDVVCVSQGSLDEKRRQTLHDFAASGRGLLVAGLGWGWMQVAHNDNIREHPASLLLRDAGIAWADGTLSKTGKIGFLVGDVPAAAHAAKALELLQAGGPDLSQPGATLTSAAQTLPLSNNPLMARCQDLLKAHEKSLAPTSKAPLTSKDGLDRTLLALQVELDRQLPIDQIKPHPAAAAFPGEVPADAPRITREVAIDLHTPAWHSTGLYAPPGSIVTLTVPKDAQSCSVRIGCHTDHLWHLDKWQRVPDISREWKLDSASVKVASPFGGLIYIDVSKKSEGTVRIQIAGAVESPHFILGQTTHEQWLKARNAPGPWADLETKKIAITVPSSAIRSLDDPDALMQFWDKISDAHATLATIPLDRERPERYVADIEISAGYMHSGYPIMTHLDAAAQMTSLEKLRAGSWGLLHELGHNHQSGDWTFDGTVEVTCNLFALHAIDTICTPEPGHRGHEAVDKPPDVKAYIKRGAKFEEWKKEPFLALQMYIELQKEFGWETFKKVFAEYRTPQGRAARRTTTKSVTSGWSASAAPAARTWARSSRPGASPPARPPESPSLTCPSGCPLNSVLAKHDRPWNLNVGGGPPPHSDTLHPCATPLSTVPCSSARWPPFWRHARRSPRPQRPPPPSSSTLIQPPSSSRNCCPSPAPTSRPSPRAKGT